MAEGKAVGHLPGCACTEKAGAGLLLEVYNHFLSKSQQHLRDCRRCALPHLSGGTDTCGVCITQVFISCPNGGSSCLQVRIRFINNKAVYNYQKSGS